MRAMAKDQSFQATFNSAMAAVSSRAQNHDVFAGLSSCLERERSVRTDAMSRPDAID